MIRNTLQSFTLPTDISDASGTTLYAKHAGYETVRYPYSGLVGTPEARAASARHNAQYDRATAVTMLNTNIKTWLTEEFTTGQTDDGESATTDGASAANASVSAESRLLGSDTSKATATKAKVRGLIKSRFEGCMDAPTYTLFSNNTSANAVTTSRVTALENPHDYMHLAIGGYDFPTNQDSLTEGANGDMGENNTAGLDPIFFFHHCFIDYAFWVWQNRHGVTKGSQLAIDPKDPGSKYTLGSNSVPFGGNVNEILSPTTPLYPFYSDETTPFTSEVVTDIEGSLGYTFGPASLDVWKDKTYKGTAEEIKLTTATKAATKTFTFKNLNRGTIPGSFLVAAYAEINGRMQLVGLEPVLNRWNVSGCANCMTRLEVNTQIAIPANATALEIVLHTRGGKTEPYRLEKDSKGALTVKADAAKNKTLLTASAGATNSASRVTATFRRAAGFDPKYITFEVKQH